MAPTQIYAFLMSDAMMAEISDVSLLAALAGPAAEIKLPSSLPVTYKGVGRSSGDAPRAAKAILLNRLVACYGREAVKHIGGDSYKVGDRAITFRVTASPHRASLPWFNLSSREVRNWLQRNTAVIVIGVYPLKETGNFVGTVALLRPEYFGNLENAPTKASEKQPSALFEIKHESDGLTLFNASSKGEVRPRLISEDQWKSLELSPAETRILAQAYAVERDPDPTSGGRFKPLTLLVDPGEASAEELAELLSEISKLYRMVGGSGIAFKLTDVRRPVEVHV